MPEDDDVDPEQPVVLPIEDTLDLHSIPPREVKETVLAYLEEAAARGFREVRLIHGRGTGTQRAQVRLALERCPHVEAFADAPPDRGGWGATVVTLRSPS